MKHPISKATEAELVSREHLVRLLVEQIERTYAADGPDKALEHITDLLRGLDVGALRGLVYTQGLQGEDELIEPEPDTASRHGGSEIE
jgi:hypothetical protein